MIFQKWRSLRKWYYVTSWRIYLCKIFSCNTHTILLFMRRSWNYTKKQVRTQILTVSVSACLTRDVDIADPHPYLEPNLGMDTKYGGWTGLLFLLQPNSRRRLSVFQAQLLGRRRITHLHSFFGVILFFLINQTVWRKQFIFPGQESVWRISKNKQKVIFLHRNTKHLLDIASYCEVDLLHL